MFGSMLRRLMNPRAPTSEAPLRLHIGGEIAHPEWKIFNIHPGPVVDYAGHCADLSRFTDGSVSEIYASHVLEHLRFKDELPAALREFYRVLHPGAMLRVSVPDLHTLCRLFLDPELSTLQRFQVMQMMFGGQTNDADTHYVGLDENFLSGYLSDAGFTGITRVDAFNLFDDTSAMHYKLPISLNMTARKPAAA